MSTTEVPETTLVQFAAKGTARRRLYCFPFAGGGPATFRLWPTSLDDDVEVTVVVAAGRDPRRRSPDVVIPGSVGELVTSSIRAIKELQASSPLSFAMFGHSMGALIAHEMTIELEQRAETGAGNQPLFAPTRLFVSGRRAPDELHRGEQIHTLSDDDFLDAMQRNYGGVPDLVRNEPDLLALFLPGLRADAQVFETYRPLTSRRVACPVRVYGGDDDRGPRPDQLGAWQRLAESEISLRTFPGGHFFLDEARLELNADIMAHWNSPPLDPSTSAP